MSRMGYFAPGIVGVVVGLVYVVFGGAERDAAERVTLGCILVPVLFALCQLSMIASQGVFARVLPVPVGRSIRGGKCLAIGLLIDAAIASSLIAILLVRVETDTTAVVVMATSGACWLAAVLVYLWSLPTAVADFVRKDGV